MRRSYTPAGVVVLEARGGASWPAERHPGLFPEVPQPHMGSPRRKELETHSHENRPNVLDPFPVSKGVLTGNVGLRILPDTVEAVRFPARVGTGTYPVPIRFGRGWWLAAGTPSSGFRTVPVIGASAPETTA